MSATLGLRTAVRARTIGTAGNLPGEQLAAALPDAVPFSALDLTRRRVHSSDESRPKQGGPRHPPLCNVPSDRSESLRYIVRLPQVFPRTSRHRLGGNIPI